MSSQIVTPNTEAAILARLIQATESRSEDVARYLLSIDFETSDVNRMNILSERAREGTLTKEEAAELDSYLHVGTLLSIVQSRARRVLKSADGSLFPSVNQALIRQVWDRAKNRCEYCHIPHPYYRLPFQIDHIVARQHGGMATINNLALACFHCNCHKGPNLSGWDGGLDRVIRLFHPRSDLWDEHLEFDGPRFLGKTPVGRVTIHVLAMNSEDMMALRIELLQEGILL